MALAVDINFAMFVGRHRYGFTHTLSLSLIAIWLFVYIVNEKTCITIAHKLKTFAPNSETTKALHLDDSLTLPNWKLVENVYSSSNERWKLIWDVCTPCSSMGKLIYTLIEVKVVLLQRFLILWEAGFISRTHTHTQPSVVLSCWPRNLNNWRDFNHVEYSATLKLSLITFYYGI